MGQPVTGTVVTRRAYSYKRFSSPKQARGDSIRRQTEFEQRIVKEMDLLLDDTLDLSDTGVSAFYGKNNKFGALAEFMKLVESGRIPEGSVLIVENIDRLSRENVFDAFNLFSRIIGAGITLVTAEPYDVYDKATVQSNVAKLMVPLVYMMRAHDESKTKSHRIHQAWNQRRKRAIEEGRPLSERCPYWLKVVGKQKFEVVEERAQVVRQIYGWVREGLGITRIVKRLVESETPCFGKKGVWQSTYVRKLLTWPAVCGEMQPFLWKEGKRVPHGEPRADFFPAIISREEYDLTRATMKDRRGKDGRPARDEGNLFTGLVWHAGDRVKMSMKSHNGEKKRTPYLMSNLVYKGKPAGEGRRFPYEKFEKGVLTALSELRLEDVSDRFREQKSDLGAQVEKLSSDLLIIDARHREFESQALDPNNKIPADALSDLLSKLAALRQQIVENLVSFQMEAKSCPAEARGEERSVLARMRSMPPGSERDRFRRKVRVRLRWLVESIWVHIEKVNHVRQFAHVQVFLRNGMRHSLLIESFEAKSGRPKVRPARHYHDVDFRTFKPPAHSG